MSSQSKSNKYSSQSGNLDEIIEEGDVTGILIDRQQPKSNINPFMPSIIPISSGGTSGNTNARNNSFVSRQNSSIPIGINQREKMRINSSAVLHSSTLLHANNNPFKIDRSIWSFDPPNLFPSHQRQQSSVQQQQQHYQDIKMANNPQSSSQTYRKRSLPIVPSTELGYYRNIYRAPSNDPFVDVFVECINCHSADTTPYLPNLFIPMYNRLDDPQLPPLADIVMPLIFEGDFLAVRADNNQLVQVTASIILNSYFPVLSRYLLLLHRHWPLMFDQLIENCKVSAECANRLALHHPKHD